MPGLSRVKCCKHCFESELTAMAWHPVCPQSELSPNQGREFLVADKVVALFFDGQTIYALDGMCAHQGGPIAQGRIDGKCVTCPWHGWQYDICSGKNLLTGKKMLASFAVKVSDGHVWLEV